MANQLNSQANVLTKPQGSPYCADPDCESCKELREMQERIRSENVAPQIVAKAAGPEITRPISRDGFPGNGSNYRRGN